MYAIIAISHNIAERKQYQAELEQLIADLDDVRKNLRVKIEASDAEISVESLPRVEADEEQVQQVFQNLLANAIQFSGEEQLRVHISAKQNGTEWLSSVTDEGIGIDPGNQKYDFEVFKGLQGSKVLARESALQSANGVSNVRMGECGLNRNSVREPLSPSRNPQSETWVDE